MFRQSRDGHAVGERGPKTDHDVKLGAHPK